MIDMQYIVILVSVPQDKYFEGPFSTEFAHAASMLQERVSKDHNYVIMCHTLTKESPLYGLSAHPQYPAMI